MKSYQELKNWGATIPFIRSVYFIMKQIYVKCKIVITLFRRNIADPLEHYYSPFPAMKDIKQGNFSSFPDKIPAIDLNDKEQLQLLNDFAPYYDEIPFKDKKEEGLRYYFVNGYYSYMDGTLLYCMLRHLQPRNIVEAGSGFSSGIILDTTELFLDKETQCTFIEPFPTRLKSLIKPGEKTNTKIYENRLQDIPLEFFRNLKENDVLFIDSTHVSKYNSDVNYIIHEILPEIAHGVYIHFHDIFYPFEYPKEWLLKGVAWNEQYLLRAFLEYNTQFKIVLFNTYLQRKYEEQLRSQFPLIYKSPVESKNAGRELSGGSIWLKKI